MYNAIVQKVGTKKKKVVRIADNKIVFFEL